MERFIQSIPRSTHHGWEKDKGDKFFGFKYASSIGDRVNDLNLFYDEKVARKRQLFIAYTKLKITILNVIGKNYIKDGQIDRTRVYLSRNYYLCLKQKPKLKDKLAISLIK